MVAFSRRIQGPPIVTAKKTEQMDIDMKAGTVADVREVLFGLILLSVE